MRLMRQRIPSRPAGPLSHPGGEVPVRMAGFRNFIIRGNLVELAVAVVIGTQLSNLVRQFVSSFVNPLISLAGGTPDLGNLTQDREGHVHLRPVRDGGPVLPDLRRGGLFHPGPAGQPPAPAAGAEPGCDHEGLPHVHDEHPGRGATLPEVHGRDHAGYRAAAAGQLAAGAAQRRHLTYYRLN